ncbi:MAG: Unknown protein [uncultured Sulfurovum sp.]|uniref:Uncharacterized protein n=1 Tax=uncultured Sulfurovum sp. TaxID=269237 RepID=A0A6S6SFZ4_9BACT|nr:MAG: Unknown protein [uncultured Sulfurovum sp.]
MCYFNIFIIEFLYKFKVNLSSKNWRVRKDTELKSYFKKGVLYKGGCELNSKIPQLNGIFQRSNFRFRIFHEIIII